MSDRKTSLTFETEVEKKQTLKALRQALHTLQAKLYEQMEDQAYTGSMAANCDTLTKLEALIEQAGCWRKE